jgi:hypothetical protein
MIYLHWSRTKEIKNGLAMAPLAVTAFWLFQLNEPRKKMTLFVLKGF